MTARDVLTLLLGFGLEGIAAWLSVLCARRRPRQHRPVAAYLVLLAASDPFRTVLRLCRDADAPHPLTGAARALYHLDACGFLVVTGLLAVLAVVVFGGEEADARRRAWLTGGIVAGMAAVNVVAYPGTAATGPALYAVTQFGAVALGWAAVVAWARRGTWPTISQIIVLVLLAEGTAILAGPYVAPDLFDAWPLAWSAGLAAQIAIVAVQATWLKSATMMGGAASTP
jgi:hypothetical protein